jgi:hypothetical protein
MSTTGRQGEKNMATKNPLRKKITTTKSINATVKKGGEETPVKEFEEKTTTTSNNTITVAVGVTKNMGNYESLRVDVAFTGEFTDREATFEEAKNWVVEKLESTVNEILGEE